MRGSSLLRIMQLGPSRTFASFVPWFVCSSFEDRVLDPMTKTSLTLLFFLARASKYYKV